MLNSASSNRLPSEMQVDKRIGILVVSHTYVVGVNQRKVEEMARISDLSVSLLIPSRFLDLLRDTKAECLTPSSFEMISSPVLFAGHQIRYLYHPGLLWRTLSRLRPDVVQVEEEPGSLSLLQLGLLKRLFGFKLIFFTWENIFRTSLAYPIEKVNLALADGAIAGNREAATVLRRKGFKGPVEVITQLGVDVEDFTCVAKAVTRENLGLRGFVVGYVGRLVEEKGLLSLVGAFARLDTEATLLFVGKGPLKPAVRLLASELGIEHKWVVVDAVKHDEVPAYLSCLDVLVLPSRSGKLWKEQFGHVLIEAMASGIPVVGSSSGAIPEVIGSAGLIFPEGDVAALREALGDLAHNPNLRTRLSELGKKRVAENFTHQEVARRTREFYDEILPRR